MRTVNELLSQGHLNYLIECSKNLGALTKKLQSLLPAHLAAYCLVASWDQHKIIVHCTNAAAGTVLRYQLPKLLPLLQLDERYRDVREITCHIRPPQGKKMEMPFNQPPLHSVFAATLLESAAENINTPEIKIALKRLANSVASGNTNRATINSHKDL